MQRIEEKRIDNSSLVPRRIAEQRTDWRQPKPLGVDLSGLQRGFNALGKLADYVGNEFDKANREMDELAEIKVNSIVKNAELEAKGKFENFTLTQLPNEIPGIRTAFSESVRNQIKDVPMTSRMRETVNAKLSAIDENMKVSMRYELERKRAKYVVDEHIALYNDALQNGNTELALSQRQKLQDLGVSVKQSEADIKSNGAVHALRASFDLNDFENIEKLEAAKDGKYIHFSELRQNERMELIRYGKQRQSALQNENYKKYLVDIVDGNDKYTIAQYKEMFENGGIDERAYIFLVEGKQARNYVSMIDNLALTSEADFPKVKETYLNILETEKADNNLSEHQYNEVKKALNHKEYTVAKNAIERLQAQQTAANKQQKYMQNMFLGVVRSKIPPLNPFENMQQKQIVIDNMKNIFKDPNVQLHMVTEIEKIFSEGLEGKGIFDTPQGAAFKKWFDIQYRTEKGEGVFNVSKLEYDPAGRGDWDSEEFVAYRGYELLQYGAELLKTGMTENKVKELVQERFNQMTEERAKEIMHKIELQNSYINKNTVKGK